MQFRDLQKQYQVLKPDMNKAISQVLTDGNFVSGRQVSELEDELAAYVGVKHCTTCGNGTDALTLALVVWDIGPGDAVFVPDFTFLHPARHRPMPGQRLYLSMWRRILSISLRHLWRMRSYR